MIKTPQELDETIKRLNREPCVAVDTEFVWERTFYARLGLIQLGTTGGDCFLLDPVKLTDLSPLGQLLANPRIVKVLHDAPQDLMILRRATGVVPCNIFDTRLAAGFAGLSSEISLQNILTTLLEITLPKSHTRTNWMARPLSPEQLEYAADDVRYLCRIATLLREKARQNGVEAWLDEELKLLDDPTVTEERSPKESYRRIRAAARLQARPLAILRELAAWREQEAQTFDLPRQHVAEDSELVSISITRPLQPLDLEKCRDLSRQTKQRHGTPLLAAVQRGLALSDSECPNPMPALDDRAFGKERISAITDQIRTLAEAKFIDARLVSSKNDILMLLHDGVNAPPDKHRILRGWRAELLGTLPQQWCSARE